MAYAPAPSIPRVMTRQARTTLAFCLSVALTGPFGLVIGPALAWFLNRRTDRLYPAAAAAARARGGPHYTFGQILALTACALWGLVGLFALAPSILLFWTA